ncbi:hypothetical protein ACWCPT_35280 [Streptomyces sp. NPDC002308]
MARPSSCRLELRKRAVRMAAEKLGIGSAETLRNWVKRDEIDSGQRPGVTSEESAAVKALKTDIARFLDLGKNKIKPTR